MSMRVPDRWSVVAALALLITSCGSDSHPTVEELQAALLTAGDLGPGWVVEYSGGLTDEMRSDPGGIDMCPEAESIVAPISEGRQSTGDWNRDWQSALIALDWQVAVFTLPVDREDAAPVSLVQGLVVGDRDTIETVYTALSDGYRLCLATPPTSGNHSATAAELTLPSVGSERFGWVLSMGDEDRWDTRWIIVRDSAVLMSIQESEVLRGENILSDQEVFDIVVTAASRLP